MNLNNRMEVTEEEVSELESRLIKIILSEQQKTRGRLERQRASGPAYIYIYIAKKKMKSKKKI